MTKKWYTQKEVKHLAIRIAEKLVNGEKIEDIIKDLNRYVEKNK